MRMKKLVITVIGADQVGIIAAVSRYLADENINILNISQTITDGIFSMVLMCDMEKSVSPVNQVQDSISQIGQKIGVDIRAQLADIFYAMHRI
jgi:ACT domain-containing protein